MLDVVVVIAVVVVAVGNNVDGVQFLHLDAVAIMVTMMMMMMI